MEKSYTDTFELRSLACDMQGRWKPGAILETMQEIAGDHCARLGLPRPVMDGLGIAWVLSRVRVQLKRQPRMGETISASTWPLPPRHLFYPRVNAFLDGEGNEIGGASSLWLLMDLKSRQSVSADRLPQPLPDNSDMEEPLRWPGGIAPMEAPERRTAYEAVYTDLDANGHVNNTKYADWLCNVLGTEVMTHTPVRELTIHFDHEIRPDQEVELRIRQDGLRFQMCGVHEDLIAFEMSGILMDSAES